MTLKLDIRSDIKQHTRKLTKIQRRILPKVQQQAINRTVQKVRTETIREISKITGLKQKDIRAKMSKKLATKLNLVGAIIAKAFAPNLARFNARLIKGAAGITAKAWRVKRVYKGTFFGNKKRTVFKRTGESRLPIAPVHGPSLPRTFISKQVQKVMKRTARVTFSKNFKQILDFQLTKLR